MIVASKNPYPAPRRWLWLACLFAAIPHVVFYAYCPQVPLSPDEEEYLSLGTGLAQTGKLQLSTGEAALRMPFYPLFIAGVHKWQESELWQNGIQMLQTFISWCSVIVIAVTAERLAGERAGLLAAVIAGLYSPFLFLQMSFLTETFLVLFLSLAILVYITAGIQHRSVALHVAALVTVSWLIGLAVLTRADALVLIVPFVVDAALRRGSGAQRSARVVILLIPLLVCVVGWGLRNERMIGKFTLSTYGGLNFYLGHCAGYSANPGLDHADYQIFRRLRKDGLTELQADQELFRRGYAYIADHPGQTVIDTGSKLFVWLRTTVKLSAPTLLPLALGVLAVYGWLQDRRAPLRGRKRTLYLAAFAAFWPALVFWLVIALETNQVWTSPLYIVPIGLISLFLIRPNVRGLLLGVFGSQLAVALVFIPIERLRWTVDGILILAIAVGVSQLCEWLSPRTTEAALQSPATQMPNGE